MIRQIHVADALPPDYTVLVKNVHVRNKASPSIQFIGNLVRVREIGIGDFHGKDAEKFQDVGL